MKKSHKAKCSINGFKYPAADKISSRTSTICRSMACTLLKREACSSEEEQAWKHFFPNKTCAYCGGEAKHLDHLYPLIKNRRPTGYWTEPANLVPCCRECNQPKGNLAWDEYMDSEQCKHQGNVADIQRRKDTLAAFQARMPAQKIEISEEILLKWDEMLGNFDIALQEARNLLEEIREEIY